MPAPDIILTSNPKHTFGFVMKFLIYLPDYGDTGDLAVRAKYGYLEAVVSIIGNVLLFLIKLFLGLKINSIALIADAVHTLSDVGTSIVVILGFKAAKKPPDKEHPFGHGRVEHIATLVIALLLAVTGLGFIKQSIDRILNPVEFEHGSFTLLVGAIVLISAIPKEWMARFSLAVSKKIKSDVLVGDAWHHRSDALASLAVGLSIIGASHGYPLLDPIFGIVVSIIIIYVGISLFKKSSNFLIGHGPDQNTIEEIQALAGTMETVQRVFDIHSHDYGTSKIISLTVEVENHLTVDEAHKIADDLEKRIGEHLNCSTIIHLEPRELHLPIKIKGAMVEDILRKQEDIVSFHKIQIIRGGTKDDIRMHLVVDNNMSIADAHKLCHRLASIIETEYGPSNVDIHFEPCCKDCKMCTIISCGRRVET